MSKLSDKLYAEIVKPLTREYLSSRQFFKELDEYYVLTDTYFFYRSRAVIIRKSDLRPFWYSVSGKLTARPKTFDSNYNPDFFLYKDGIKIYNFAKKYPDLMEYISKNYTCNSLHFFINTFPILRAKKRIFDLIQFEGQSWYAIRNKYDRINEYIRHYGTIQINGLDDDSLSMILSNESTQWTENYFFNRINIVPTLKDRIRFLPYIGNQTYADYIYFRNYLYSDNIPKRYPKFPKKELLNKLHDELSVLYNQKKEIEERDILTEINNRYLSNSFKKSKSLEYSNDKYSIICPKHIVELNTEGSVLHHCVASYKESVAEGKEYILFLRNNSNLSLPFMTINITKNGDCRQIHGKYNNCIKDQPDSSEIIKFLNDWADNKKFLNKKSIIENCNQIHCHL